MRAIMTVVGPDRVGIVAGVTTLLAALNINILDLSQTIMGGIFTMTLLVDTLHAFAIEPRQGVEVMVHVGLGTVNMEGAGFEPLASVGDPVAVGQPLLRFDRSLIHSNGYKDTVITAVVKDDQPERPTSFGADAAPLQGGF